MPHIIVEYSSNLTSQLDISELLKELHQTALDNAIFPIGGLRTRAVMRSDYVIADDHPDNAFIHVTVRIGHGRDLSIKRQVGEQLMSTLSNYLAEIFRTIPLAISLEMQELDSELSFKQNNLHAIVKQRGA